jgi:signal transduction histidine kinase
MSELRPELLDQLGLVAALEWEAERFQKRSGLKCQFTSELGEFQFDPKKSIALFRIFQEAVTNVARHAQATTVEVSVRREKNDVLLEIKDNGIGIEPNAEHKARSFGLVGMRERAVLLGGTLEITGIKGRGTTILVRMPFEQTLPDGGAAL